MTENFPKLIIRHITQIPGISENTKPDKCPTKRAISYNRLYPGIPYPGAENQRPKVFEEARVGVGEAFYGGECRMNNM